MTLRDRFDAMVDTLSAVQTEMHALADRARDGQMPSASALRGCELAWPAIAAQWAGLKHLQRTGDAWPADERVEALETLIHQLHVDLRVLHAVLTGRVSLGDLENN